MAGALGLEPQRAAYGLRRVPGAGTGQTRPKRGARTHTYKTKILLKKKHGQPSKTSSYRVRPICSSRLQQKLPRTHTLFLLIINKLLTKLLLLLNDTLLKFKNKATNAVLFIIYMYMYIKAGK